MRLTHNIWIAFSGESCHPHTVHNTDCEENETVFINDKDEFGSILQVFHNSVQHVLSTPAKHSVQFLLSLTNERTVSATDLDGTSSEKGDNDGDNVDGQLKLKEFCDAVIDVATPHHRLDDTRKVVVSQDNVRRLLRHVRTGYALQVT